MTKTPELFTLAHQTRARVEDIRAELVALAEQAAAIDNDRANELDAAKVRAAARKVASAATDAAHPIGGLVSALNELATEAL